MPAIWNYSNCITFYFHRMSIIWSVLLVNNVITGILPFFLYYYFQSLNLTFFIGNFNLISSPNFIFFHSRRFCVGDRFYLCDNKILCEYDYEERLVFANMSYHPSSLAHIRRQVSNLQVRITMDFNFEIYLNVGGFLMNGKCEKIHGSRKMPRN